MILSFAHAIQMALIPGVPCALPYSDIELLQIIRSDHVQTQYGFFKNKYVLVNPGSTAETLFTCFSNDVLDAGGKSPADRIQHKKDVLEELKKIVDKPGRTKMLPLEVTWDASQTQGFCGSTALKAALASVGYEMENDKSWSLTIDGEVTKTSVALAGLESVLMRSQINYATNIIGIVTAIYVITGGISFTEKVKRDTKARAELVAPSALSIEGWKGEVIGSEIHLKSDNPVDWVVAVEYLRVDGTAKAFTGLIRWKHDIKSTGPLMSSVGDFVTLSGGVMMSSGDAMSSVGDVMTSVGATDFAPTSQEDLDVVSVTQDFFDLGGINFAPLDVALPLLTYEEHN